MDVPIICKNGLAHTSGHEIAVNQNEASWHKSQLGHFCLKFDSKGFEEPFHQSQAPF
jgi:hypothetical protein